MITVKSSERTLRILEIISKNKSGVSFSDIQKELSLPKSSLFSLLKELLNNQYLSFNENNKKYYSGISFIKLCTNGIENTDLIVELNLLTANLTQELKQVSHAGILDKTSIIYLAKSEINSTLSLMKSIGLKIPAHCTAVGKMLLSQFTSKEIEKIYFNYNFEKYTEYSISSLSYLIKEIDKVRKNGYAIELREANILAGCISLPLVVNGEILAAFSVTFPAYTFEQADINSILSIMHKHKKITEEKIKYATALL